MGYEILLEQIEAVCAWNSLKVEIRLPIIYIICRVR